MWTDGSLLLLRMSGGSTRRDRQELGGACLSDDRRELSREPLARSPANLARIRLKLIAASGGSSIAPMASLI